MVSIKRCFRVYSGSAELTVVLHGVRGLFQPFLEFPDAIVDPNIFTRESSCFVYKQA